MKFRTEIHIPSSGFTITHKSKIMMIGSCFVENISAKLLGSGFHVDVNPFGIVYNPVSVHRVLEDILRKREYQEEELFMHQGIYHSFSHHSRFSGLDPKQVIENINSRIGQSFLFLREADFLIITYGTANVYYQVDNGEPVANCHKLPSALFRNARLMPEDIFKSWGGLLPLLRKINPGIKIIFTISPVRHWKDGAHDNQVSKSILFVGLDKLISTHDNMYYFPSYELMMDDLRDYRFYAEDMLHPGSQAVEYIWSKFLDTYLTETTRSTLREWESIRQAVRHRPFNPESDEYRRFLEKTEERKANFLSRNPDFLENLSL